MKSIRMLAPAVLSAALVSCASQSADTYDTGEPYAAPDAGMAQAPLPEYENPVYDAPAAYEDSGSAAPAPIAPAGSPAPAAPDSNGSAVIHTVVKGDTLSGLSSKYKVPIESIKRANKMTNDTVVLGRKMVIPPR
jgi:LysM repeat protein